MAMTEAERQARSARRDEILSRVKASGEIPDPTEQVTVAKAIEAFEYAGGDATLSARRRAVTPGLLSSGAVKLRNIVDVATAQIAALDDFKE